MPAVRFGKFVAESVLQSYGLHRRVSVEALVKEAKKFDVTNKGYLSRDEFVKAAEALARRVGGSSTTGTQGDVRYARGLAKEVHQEYLRGNPNKRFTEAQLVDAAKAHDNGDRYLNRKELEAGAIDLQLGRDAGTLSKKLGELWDRGRFPAALARPPSTTGLRKFDLELTARALGDTVDAASAWLDEKKGRVLVKATVTERLPWEGATSSSTDWYAVPLATLR